MAAVKHPHDDAGGDGNDDEKHHGPADRGDDDAGVFLRKGFCRKTREQRQEEALGRALDLKSKILKR